jgi:hypothetical protein
MLAVSDKSYIEHMLFSRANVLTPPTLAASRLATLLAMYLCGLGWWLTSFLRHFRKRDERLRTRALIAGSKAWSRARRILPQSARVYW